MPYVAGELHPIGEEELYTLAQRLRGRFPGLLAGGAYFPRRFPIVSTNVARTAASASAFSLGFFQRSDNLGLQAAQPPTPTGGRRADPRGWRGVLAGVGSFLSASGGFPAAGDASMGESGGGGRPQPVAISMLPADRDPVLRFFSMCPNYSLYELATAAWLAPWRLANWSRLAPAIAACLGLPASALPPLAVDALWQLCGAQAGLLGERGGDGRGGACDLFSEDDARVMELLEDLKLYHLQGYGAAINYEIAAPLLADIAHSLHHAAAASGGSGAPLQRARLMFAHCETLVPLAALLGLFQPGAQEEAAMLLPRSAHAPAGAARGWAAAERVRRLDAPGDDATLLLEAKAGGGEAEHGGEAPAAAAAAGWGRALAATEAVGGRVWRGGRVSPLGANIMLVLYRQLAPGGDRDSGRGGGAAGAPHLVRAVYNEQVVQLPGCDAFDCPLDVFLSKVVGGKADPDALERLCYNGAGALEGAAAGASNAGAAAAAS